MKSALAIPFVVAALFAGSFVAGKIAARELSPLTTSFLRYLPALALLVALALARDRAALRLHPRDLVAMALLGLTGIVGYHYFFFASLRLTTAANAATIGASSPIVTAALCALFFSERLSFSAYAGILTAVAGVILLVTGGRPDQLFAGGVGRGDALMMLAVLSWALYALGVKRLSHRHSPLALTLWPVLTGMAMLLPMALVEGMVDQARRLTLPIVGAILYMGLAASGVGYLLYTASVVSIGPTRTSSVVYSTVPLLAAPLSWLMLKEPLSLVLVVSVVLVVVGLRLTLRRST